MNLIAGYILFLVITTFVVPETFALDKSLPKSTPGETSAKPKEETTYFVYCDRKSLERRRQATHAENLASNSSEVQKLLIQLSGRDVIQWFRDGKTRGFRMHNMDSANPCVFGENDLITHINDVQIDKSNLVSAELKKERWKFTVLRR